MVFCLYITEKALSEEHTESANTYHKYSVKQTEKKKQQFKYMKRIE